ncbi:MAG TPA: 5-deoxy-glucuronate isomerase [Solirubrobacteraceae bacterium]|nr:5-deoxy-glucuronate isomerase [Solirubrobacteraceae bacterium]
MSELIVSVTPAAPDGTILQVTPQSARWWYVGFEVLALSEAVRAERDCGGRECCVVVVEGTADIASSQGSWTGVGGRRDPWSGPPEAVYLPPGSTFSVTGEGEVALCWAPAPRGDVAARRLPGEEIEVETRGHGALERTVHPILMGDREAESLLVCEVLTPAGHWSSYPPHKHDVDDPPRETLLEETYYHRLAPAQGFALQRIYSQDRALDETLSVRNRDCVLVPRGYHTVSAPPGYELYYLNVMAGPTRLWAVANDPDHDWTLTAQEHER